MDWWISGLMGCWRRKWKGWSDLVGFIRMRRGLGKNLRLVEACGSLWKLVNAWLVKGREPGTGIGKRMEAGEWRPEWNGGVLEKWIFRELSRFSTKCGPKVATKVATKTATPHPWGTAPVNP